ncbi:IPT/TIG domain-containing protein [Leifsonia xyli]|uniref:IPT/TIG domain-containing protein n=1 Tax=Leifsonia xyli TaxID=1575 RepID=UPI003D668F8D
MSFLSRTRRPLVRRTLVLGAVAASAALVFSGCAGEPSPVTKAIAQAAAPSAASASSVVSSIQPATGSVSGGTVTLTGTNLDNVGAVTIGGSPPPSPRRPTTRSS